MKPLSFLKVQKKKKFDWNCADDLLRKDRWLVVSYYIVPNVSSNEIEIFLILGLGILEKNSILFHDFITRAEGWFLMGTDPTCGRTLP